MKTGLAGLNQMENKAPRVSIITPSYNQGQFLEHTIRSVLSQEYPDIEYIVIDGGSTDDSLDIIKRYSDKITYWTSRKDNGQVEAINEGFKRATGEYVAWLNSDDLYLPGCIQTAVLALQANPQAAMVFGNVEVVNERGKRLGMFRPVSYRFEDFLTYKIIIPQQAAFFRRNILDEIGALNPGLHFALDHEFFLRIGERYPIVGISDVIAQYRISRINKGSTLRSKWAEEFIRILDAYFVKPEADKKFGMLKQDAYAWASYNGAGGLLDDGFYSLARQWYLRAAKFQPKLLLGVRWWIGLLRTFWGQNGNVFYLDLKFWLAKKGLLDIRYDWWMALRLAEEEK